MNFSDLLSMCVRNLTRRKFRTFLTVTGVVIGTCAIVVMISIGVGISESTEKMLEQLGDLTIVNVYSQSSDTPIDEDAVAAMQSLENVNLASPTMRYNPQGSSMELYAGKRDKYLCYYSFTGVYPDALELLGKKVDRGTLDLGENGKKINLVFGPMIPYEFEDTRKRWPNNRIDGWPDENGNMPEPFFDPMEAEYKLKISPAKDGAKMLEFDMNLSGLMPYQENDWESMYTIYISIDNLKKIKAAFEKENSIKKDKEKSDSYEQVIVKVNHIDNVRAVVDSIKEMGYYPSSMEDFRENIQKSTQQTQMALGALGGVSLFVAAISITNTMIMSVYERTREIGVMKVLGCLVNNIRTIFLMEAGLIGFSGGVIGIGLSYLLSFLLNKFGGQMGGGMMGMGMEGAQISVIPLWLVLLGMIFSTLIGLGSGFYPANRAVRISALEAIRQE